MPETARAAGPRSSRNRSSAPSDSQARERRLVPALRLRPADVEDHVVAETGQLVGVAAALEQHLDPADRRQPARQGQEEAGIDDQLLLVRDAAPHPPRQLGRRQRARGAVELHRGVERLEQRQAAHVADEDRAAGGHRRDRAFQHLHQVVDARGSTGRPS